MKKLFIFLTMIFASAGLFAYSGDIGFIAGETILHEDFEVSSKRYVSTQCDFSSGFQNYNFFDSEDHFGFFEKLSVVDKDDFGLDFLTGAGFGFNIYKDLIRVQTGAGFHMLFAVEEGNTDFSNGGSADLFKFALGVGADFQMKFLPEKMFSPTVGFDVSWNPYCRSGVTMSGSNYYLSYDSFSLVAFRPFVGCIFNIPSKKNNSSQHDDYAGDFQR